jgi:GNAT superfamily N-acetyltransferase
LALGRFARRARVSASSAFDRDPSDPNGRLSFRRSSAKIEQMFASALLATTPDRQEGCGLPRIPHDVRSVLTAPARHPADLDALTVIAGQTRLRGEFTPVRTASVHLRPYEYEDKHAVVELLKALPGLYPGGDEWLDARLDAVAGGVARCTVAFLGSRAVGTTIESAKSARRLKLSTIWVDPALRGRGVGTTLLSAAASRWRDEGRDEVYVTSDLDVAPAVFGLVAHFGFEPTAIEWSRYGPRRHEAVFGWTRRH